MTCNIDHKESDLVGMARDALARYRSGDMSFPRLVDSLDGIISNFDVSEWVEEVRGHWGVLEQVYAVDLDRGVLNDMSTQSLELIDEAASELDRLFAQVGCCAQPGFSTAPESEDRSARGECTNRKERP